MVVEKAGIQDTLQDAGRFGYAHSGINAGGAMDRLALALANALVGNPVGACVLEMHYPAPRLRFPNGATIALAGAHFGAHCGSTLLPVCRRIALAPGSIVHFTGKRWGQRCYLAVAGGFEVEQVLGSASTNIKSGFGGWKGRALLTGDVLPIRSTGAGVSNGVLVANWFLYPWYWYRNESEIAVLPGPE
jgi:antagonist of KipI